MSTPKGYPIEGLHEKDGDPVKGLKQKFTTVPPKGQNRRGLDVVGGGFYEVSTGLVVEAGSDDQLIVLTGHSILKGDLIRPTATANSIPEPEMFVDEIIDANTIKLVGATSASFTAGDTFDLYRFVSEKVAPDGSSLATLTTPPISILRGASGVFTQQTVTKDTAVAANTIPIPVEIVSGSGTTINITAGDINIQSSHTGANPDSMQIGDGTEIMLVNASGEAQVRDDDANTTLTSIDGKDFATQTTLASVDGKLNSLGQKTMVGSVPVVIASDQSAINVNNISGTISLPTGAATEAKQDSQITLLTSLDGKDFATETTLSAINTRAANIDTSTASLATTVNLSNQLEVRLADLNGAATEATLSSIDGKDFATETTLAAMSAKLPASLGKKANAASLSVTLSNDEGSLPGSAFDVVETSTHDFGSVNVTNSAWVQLVASTSAEIYKMAIFMSNGNAFELGIGAAAAETRKLIVPPGGLAHLIEVNIPAGSRLSMRALGASLTSGQLIINHMG